MGLSWLIRFKGRSSLNSVQFNHNNAGDGQAANGGGNFDSRRLSDFQRQIPCSRSIERLLLSMGIS